MKNPIHDGKKMIQLPSSQATSGCDLAAAGMSGEEFLALIRERERYQWLVEKVDRWVGLYSVPELVGLLNSRPTMPGQYQKALVALSLTEDLSALSALENFDPSGFEDDLTMLREIAIGEWRQRYRANTR